MKSTVKGHRYYLDNFEDGGIGQILQFIHKEPISQETHPQYWSNGKTPATGTLHTVSDGTTNEEVLAVLIDRMKFLQDSFPCRENAIVITKLEECLMWLNKRTADRKERGVEGKHVK